MGPSDGQKWEIGPHQKGHKRLLIVHTIIESYFSRDSLARDVIYPHMGQFLHRPHHQNKPEAEILIGKIET